MGSDSLKWIYAVTLSPMNMISSKIFGDTSTHMVLFTNSSIQSKYIHHRPPGHQILLAMEDTNMKMLVVASKERENHVNRKPQTAWCYDRSLYGAQMDTEKRVPNSMWR